MFAVMTVGQGGSCTYGASRSQAIPEGLGEIIVQGIEGLLCVVPWAVNELDSRKCRKLIQSSKKVACAKSLWSYTKVTLESL